MLFIISAIHILICIFLILVVLLQQGSGADLSVFGGGGTQTAFGARTATNLLHKLTVAGFVGFILTTIAIGFLKTGSSSGSVMSDVADEAPISAEAPETGEGLDDAGEGLGVSEAGDEAASEAPATEAPVTEGPGEGVSTEESTGGSSADS